MSVAPLFSIMICQDSIRPTVKLSLHYEKRRIVESLFPFPNVCGCYSSSTSFNDRTRWLVLPSHTELFSKARMKKMDDDFIISDRPMPFRKFTEVNSYNNCALNNYLKSSSNGISPIHHPFFTPHSSAKGCNERQLESHSYFNKLHDDMNEHASCLPTSDFGTVSDSREYQIGPTTTKAKTGLASLENYFDKLNCGMQTKEPSSPCSTKDDSESNVIKINVIHEDYYKKSASKVNTHENHVMPDDEMVPVIFSEKNFQDQPYDEASDFYLVNLLASIDIAVFLFEIASPIRSSDVEQLSLPLIYGAKINKLILDGEWWRIVTPMFLHSGFLHFALDCWALLTFGPQVCRGYGPFTIFFIYILGGICANLTSFVHTPELTVCGTGPVFAIIGAWLIYQVQNKNAIAKEVSEHMFQKAVVVTALSFVISSFEQVDEWSHLGAVFSGLVYGFLTCPRTILDKTSSDNSQKEGIALFKQQADPCKSAAIFTLFIFILCSLVFMFEHGFDKLELDDFL